MKPGLKALLRTTTFRLALVQAGLMFTFVIALLVYVYIATVGQLIRDSDTDVDQEFATLERAYAEGGMRRLNQEAAKTMRYGGATEDEAVQMMTINPAWIMGIDDKTGSIDAGKDADLVLWTGYPLSSYGVPEKVWIDGDLYFDRSLSGLGMPQYRKGQ